MRDATTETGSDTRIHATGIHATGIDATGDARTTQLFGLVLGAVFSCTMILSAFAY